MSHKLETMLDEAYKNNPNKYQENIEFIKGLGYRVFRNSAGVHKVTYNIQEIMEQRRKHQEEVYEAFFKGLLG